MSLPTTGDEAVLVKWLSRKLRQMLPHASARSCDRFLESVLSYEEVSTPLAELLNENCTPHEIHLALIHCRKVMLALSRAVPAEESETYLKRLLTHLDRQVLMLMRNMQERHEQIEEKLHADLLREGRAHLLSRAQNEWSHEKEIVIYNYFRELPLFHTLTLLHVGANGLTVSRSKELIGVFAASERGDTALSRLPYCELSVQLKVEEATGKTVHLSYGEFTPARREKRRQIRVQSSRPFRITVRNTAFRQWRGKVFDYSVSGLGLVFECETGLQPGDALAFSMMLNGHRLAGRSIVAWVKNFVGSCQAGVSIEYDAENHLRLNNEVHLRQKQIMGEIKLRGIPDCFLAG